MRCRFRSGCKFIILLKKCSDTQKPCTAAGKGCQFFALILKVHAAALLPSVSVSAPFAAAVRYLPGCDTLSKETCSRSESPVIVRKVARFRSFSCVESCYESTVPPPFALTVTNKPVLFSDSIET